MKTKLLSLFTLLLVSVGAWADTEVVNVNYAKKATDNFSYGTTVTVTKGTWDGSSKVNSQNVSPFSYTDGSSNEILSENDVLTNRDVYFRFNNTVTIGLYHANITQYGIKNLKAGDVIEVATNNGSSGTGVQPADLQNATENSGTSTYSHQFTYNGNKTLNYVVYSYTVTEDGLAGFSLTGAYVGYIKVTRPSRTACSITEPTTMISVVNATTDDVTTSSGPMEATFANDKNNIACSVTLSATKNTIRAGSTSHKIIIDGTAYQSILLPSKTTYTFSKTANIKSVKMYVTSNSTSSGTQLKINGGSEINVPVLDCTSESENYNNLIQDVTNATTIYGTGQLMVVFKVEYYEKAALTVADIEWASLYLPFAAEIPANAKVYYANATTASTVALTEITDVIPANTGVVVNASEGSYDFTAVTTAPDALAHTNLFEGVAVATDLTAGDNYVLAGSDNEKATPVFKVYGSTGTIELAAYKSYLPKSHVPNAGNAKTINFVFEGEATGISTLDNLTKSQFDNDAPMFNLAGQRVGKNYKGVVIQNGKKFMNK